MKSSRMLAICAVVILLLACTMVSSAKTKVTIGTYSDGRYKAMQALLPEWNKSYPDIEIQIEMYPDFFNKLLLLIGTDAAPDIVDTAGSFLFAHVVRGAAVDLAPYIEGDKTFDKKDFFPHVWEEVRYPHQTGQALYGLPYNWVGGVLFYNQDIFDRAGVHTPPANWQWSDLREAAKKLASDTDGNGSMDIWGTTIVSNNVILDPAVRSYGGSMLSPDRTRAVVDSPEAAHALQMLSGIILEDRTAPLPGGALFWNRNVAMSVLGSWDSAKFYQDTSLNWKTQIAPGGPKQHAIYGGSNVWEVMKRPNQDMDAVWTVLKELVSLRTVRSFTGDVPRELPARRSFVTEWPQTNLIQTLMASANYMSSDFTIDWSPWQSAKNVELTRVLRGDVTVQEGLMRAALAINNILEAARQQ